MIKSVYITSTEESSGKSAITLGVIHLLKQRIDRVSCIKPIGQRFRGDSEIDEDVLLIKNVFNVPHDPSLMSPVTLDKAQHLIGEGRSNELIEIVLEAYQEIEKDSEIVVIEGSDYSGSLAAFEFDLNAELSMNLSAPILLIANADGRTIEEILNNIEISKESFDEKGCDFLGVIVNKLATENFDKRAKKIRRGLKKLEIPLFGIMPMAPMLSQPRVGEIAAKIGAKVIYGRRNLKNLVSETKVAAMLTRNILGRINEGVLIVTPGDRDDVLIAAMMSRVANSYPSIAGVVLTGGIEPPKSVMKLIRGLSGFRVPVLAMPTDTFDTALKISKINTSLFSTDKRKLGLVQALMSKHVEQEALENVFEIEAPRKTTPIAFLHKLVSMAASDRKRIVMPEGDEERTLCASQRIVERGIADIILLGDEKKIQKAAIKFGVALGNIQILDPTNAPQLDEYISIYMELRKHKNITEYNARDLMMDPIYFGTMMVHKGDADGLVSGAVHTTAHTILPAFQIIKTKPGISLVSSIFFMCLPDKVLVYGDCAVNPNPGSAELADIAIASANTVAAFDFEPYVAMLSYSTGESGTGPQVERIREATAIIKKNAPDLKVEGPIQYDAAISPKTAKAKLPGSAVAGRANVFIFPDLDAGNTAYKAVQRSANAIAVGPVLQGLNKPVNDLSRGCLIEDIIYTVAITAIQAQ
ncbi:MAG: phosphate acetyltransferase [Candidatus Electryonea clarkiae]|nr:phosphate acetyltransferase [Candidatus Electryonea clarkiae]MDP8289054.1 phosphate acetyltransferase [Candidatus Electryonea clarkiae]